MAIFTSNYLLFVAVMTFFLFSTPDRNISWFVSVTLCAAGALIAAGQDDDDEAMQAQL
jgi:hypothetical protein